MEKTNTTTEKLYESVSLINRKNLKLEGIIEINSSSENLLSIKLKETTLTICGQNMHITHLDINTGILEVEGIITSIKYGKNENIFKRIYKWSFPTYFN